MSWALLLTLYFLLPSNPSVMRGLYSCGKRESRTFSPRLPISIPLLRGLNRQTWNRWVLRALFARQVAKKTIGIGCLALACSWWELSGRFLSLILWRITASSLTVGLLPRLQTNSLRYSLLTLAVAAVAAHVAAGGVFELAFALGADADHVGHDRARHSGQAGCCSSLGADSSGGSISDAGAAG